MTDLATLLEYSIVTGKLYWLPGTKRAGKEAGSFNKATGYIHLYVQGKQLYAHRVAWRLVTGYWPDFIDHESGVKTANAWHNIRDVTKRVNHTNMRRFANNPSGTTGVYWRDDFQKWIAAITVNRQQEHLGSFSDYASAVVARREAEARHGFHINHGRH